MKTKWLFLQRKENYCEIFVDHKYITAQTQTECPAKASTGTPMSVVLVHHLFTKIFVCPCRAVILVPCHIVLVLARLNETRQ